MKAVIDTNVLLVANGQHQDSCSDCVDECVGRLEEMMQSGVAVIDDGFLICGEYLHKTQVNPPKGAGDVFLKWLLRESGNPSRVQQVPLTPKPNTKDHFVEFPDTELAKVFDAPDRKFAAVANAHPEKPPIWQAADSKWLDWWEKLKEKGITVDFLCPEDAQRFYGKKFPRKPRPKLPS
jgi:hypothetical protein